MCGQAFQKGSVCGMNDKALFTIKLLFTLAVIVGLCAIASARAEILTVNVHEDSSLRVRKGPGTEYQSNWSISPGAEVVVIRQEANWALVAWPKYPDDPFGWVCGDYLK